MGPNTNYAALIQGILGQNQQMAQSREQNQLGENRLVEGARQFNTDQTRMNDQFDKEFGEAQKINTANIAQSNAMTDGQNLANRGNKYALDNQIASAELIDLSDNFLTQSDGGFAWKDLNQMIGSEPEALISAMSGLRQADPGYSAMLDSMGIRGESDIKQEGDKYFIRTNDKEKKQWTEISSTEMGTILTRSRRIMDKMGAGAEALNTNLETAKYANSEAEKIRAQMNRVSQSVTPNNRPQDEGYSYNRNGSQEENIPTPKAEAPAKITSEKAEALRAEQKALIESLNGRRDTGTAGPRLKEIAAQLKMEDNSVKSAVGVDANLKERTKLKAERERLYKNDPTGNADKIEALSKQIQGMPIKEVLTNPNATAGQKLKVVKDEPTEAIDYYSQDPEARVPGTRRKPPASKFSSEEQAEADREFGVTMKKAEKEVLTKSSLQDRVWLAANRRANNGLSQAEANNFAAYGSTDISTTKAFLAHVTQGTDSMKKAELMETLANINQTNVETAGKSLDNVAKNFDNERDIASVVTAATNYKYQDEYTTKEQQAAMVGEVQAQLSSTKGMLEKLGVDAMYMNRTFNNPGELAVSMRMGKQVLSQLNGGTGELSNYSGDALLVGLVAKQSGILGAGENWFTGMFVDSRARDEIKKFYDLESEIEASGANGITAGKLMAEFIHNKGTGKLGDYDGIDDYIQKRRAAL